MNKYMVYLLSLFLLITSAQSQVYIYRHASSVYRVGGYSYKKTDGRLVKNDNSITIYGKVYWHYVRINGKVYNCGDKQEIVEAIKKLNLQAKISRRDINVKEKIVAVNPTHLRDSTSPIINTTSSSLREKPRKLKP